MSILDEKFNPGLMKIFYYVTIDGQRTMKDSFILSLFDRAERDGVWPAINYGDSKTTKQDFLNKIKFHPSHNLFLVVLYNGEPAGFGLLDEMRWNHANFHFCIFSEYWGKPLAVDGSKEIYRRLLEQRFSVLIGVVPVDNVFAIEFCQKLELQEKGIIPKYFYNDKLETDIDGLQFVAVREE